MVLFAHAGSGSGAVLAAGDAVAAAAFVVAVGLYARGKAPPARLALFTAGVAVPAVVLAPAVDARAEASFTGHMAQHLALTVVAAPLLVLARPLPTLTRALPRVGLHVVRAERLLTPTTRRAQASHAVLWCTAFVLAFWAWHVPAAYEAALRYDAVHALQHTTYVATALGFWWTVLGPLRRRQPLLVGAVLFVATVQGVLAIVVFAFAGRVYYPSYAANGVGDIQVGGAFMTLSGVVYVLVAVASLGAWLARTERTAGPQADGARP